MLRCPRCSLSWGGALPGYRFPPPYTTYDVTMPYDDHREMVDPAWVAHPEELE